MDDSRAFITRFIIQNGDRAGEETSISGVLVDAAKPMFVIGGDSRAHLQLTVPEIAPAHAGVLLKDGVYTIQPRYPTTEVRVNGKRIEGATPLFPGDTVEIGGVMLGFGRVERLDTGEVALPAPKIAMPPTPMVVESVATRPAYSPPALSEGYTPTVYYPKTATETVGSGKPLLVAAFSLLFAVIGIVGVMSRVNFAGAAPTTIEDIQVAHRDGNVSVVMFTASWCQYCAQQRPIINELADGYRGDVYVRYIDIDDPANRQLVNEYGAASIPYTLIVNDEGEISDRFRGMTPRPTLVEAIDGALRESAQSPNVEVAPA